MAKYCHNSYSKYSPFAHTHLRRGQVKVKRGKEEINSGVNVYSAKILSFCDLFVISLQLPFKYI